MLDVKVYKALANTEKTVRNRFSKYVKSPYFNVNQDIINANAVLQQVIDQDLQLTKEEIWADIKKKENFDGKLFRSLMNKLLSHFEDFLAQEIYQSKRLTKTLYKLEQVKDDKYENLRNQVVKEVRTIEKRYYELSSEYHLQMYLIESLYFLISFDFQRKQRKSAKKTFSLSKTLHHLDVYYIAEKLRLIYIQLFWNQYFEEDKSDLFNDEILRAVNKGRFRNEKLLVAFYYSIRTLTHPLKENYFNSLKSLILENFDSFKKTEQQFFYDVLLTYSIRRMNKGEREYLEESYQLYRDGLVRGVVLHDNKMSPVTFRNIIFVALRLAEYEFAEEFATEYVNYLPKNERENALNFNFARISFYKKAYGEALVSMNQVNLDDLFYDLNGRTLLVALYYELDETEALLSSIQAFKNVLKRKKLSQAAKSRYNNYLKFAQKLAIVKPNDKKKLKVIQKQMEELSAVNKPWLREKMQELLPSPLKTN